MISRVRRILRHVREIGAALDYAQRRLLEIRTGIPLTPETERALVRSEIARLEALYLRPDTGAEPACDRKPDSYERRTPQAPARR
ncbi:MAG: hypothetical protein WCD11_15710 [Solirubrobacteraceae bacterium]